LRQRGFVVAQEAKPPALNVCRGLQRVHFLQQVVGLVDVLHVPQDVADVDLDVAGVGGVEVPVRDDRVQGAVEGQADQFAALVQRCRARVAAECLGHAKSAEFI